MTLHRRAFLKITGMGCALASARRSLRPAMAQARASADYTLRIGTGLVELAPQHIVSTTLYNGQFPGPLLRFTEGKRVTVDVHNNTDTPELVHWHGLMIPSEVDGAAEEGSPYIPAHGMQRISLVPKPSAFRFYHTHTVPKDDLSRGTYSGQAGPLYIEPASNPGGYDREVFLVLKEFEPSFSRGGDMAMHVLTGSPLPELQKLGEQADEQFKGPKGYEVGYELFSINGKMLGQGEPIRVKQGERLRVDHPHPAHGLIGRVLSGRTSSRVKSAFGRSWRPALKIDQYHPDPTPSRHRVAGLHGARYVP